LLKNYFGKRIEKKRNKKEKGEEPLETRPRPSQPRA